MTSVYTVRAVKWDGGWELHIDGEGETQVRTLEKADQQVRNYLETVHEADFSGAEVNVLPDLNGLEAEIIETRNEIRDAAAAQERAAKHSRDLVRRLREQGLSVADTAAVLGVTRGRVSQLTR